jgi:hypothetical protein
MRVAAAVFWFIWTGVVIPGHTRGAIQLTCSEARCCHTTNRTNSSNPKSPAPSSTNCAICAVAAKLRNESLPPPQVLKLPFAYRAIITQAAEAPALDLILSFHTRGPPDSSTANT